MCTYAMRWGYPTFTWGHKIKLSKPGAFVCMMLMCVVHTVCCSWPRIKHNTENGQWWASHTDFGNKTCLPTWKLFAQLKTITFRNSQKLYPNDVRIGYVHFSLSGKCTELLWNRYTIRLFTVRIRRFTSFSWISRTVWSQQNSSSIASNWLFISLCFRLSVSHGTVKVMLTFVQILFIVYSLINLMEWKRMLGYML